MCNNYSRLTAKIGKRLKTKFDRIDARFENIDLPTIFSNNKKVSISTT